MICRFIRIQWVSYLREKDLSKALKELENKDILVANPRHKEEELRRMVEQAQIKQAELRSIAEQAQMKQAQAESALREMQVKEMTFGGIVEEARKEIHDSVAKHFQDILSRVW